MKKPKKPRVRAGVTEHDLTTINRAPAAAPKPRSLAEELRDVLQAALDHLDWIDYGDKWENECAREAKLPEKITAVLERAKRELP